MTDLEIEEERELARNMKNIKYSWPIAANIQLFDAYADVTVPH
ncbi:hypothetical protein C7S16_4470 [Burkholderia thailandensis]|uniref:Uncharacterized protein n=1 Tax=Burkholderia thailandensis TaxID=57975 RepID=A0AAW9CKN8_BURTH|nr:hypothetical protein [Burkholderia thailandensis]